MMRKILAIDDKIDNLISIKAVIKNNIPDCEVLTALTGQDGIDIAIREYPDTILLDIIMPEMDGFETCKKLKENKQTKHIPVVMVTAIKTDSDSRAKGLNTGADAFLSKPIDALELTAQVNVMLRIKDAEDKLRKEKDVLEELVFERTRDLTVSEEKYYSIFEGVKDGILYISKDIKVIASNKSFTEITGISDEEVLGKSGISLAKKFVSTDQLPIVLGYLKSLLFDKTPNNFILNYKDKIFEISSQRIKNGRRVVVIRDITERKKAEEKEKTHHSNIDLLSKTAMRFVEFPQDGNIYDFVGEQIREFVSEDSYIVVNSVDQKTGTSTIRSVLGVSKFAKIITNKLGRHPVGMKFDVKDSNIHYSDGKLHVYQEGLYGLLLNTVPKIICESIEKLTNVKQIYVIDLAKKEQFFGSIIILLKEETVELKNKLLIETFIKQASIAILKKH